MGNSVKIPTTLFTDGEIEAQRPEGILILARPSSRLGGGICESPPASISFYLFGGVQIFFQEGGN